LDDDSLDQASSSSASHSSPLKLSANSYNAE
jgi:hypothetical protein